MEAGTSTPLREKAAADLADTPVDPDDAEDLVRKDMMLRFGPFITESSGHLSQYLPYYRKRKDLLARYSGNGYHGESSFYANNWPRRRNDVDAQLMDMPNDKVPMGWERSWEYASWKIEAAEKDPPYRIHGNVVNATRGRGTLIDNLPANGCLGWHNASRPGEEGRKLHFSKMK